MEKTKKKDHRKVLLSWETPEVDALPRGKSWYIVAGLVMGGLILYALLTRAWTMALAFAMIAFLFMLVERREPRHVKVEISDMGITYNGRYYPYHHINAFWVVYHPPYVRVLYLRIKEGRKFKYLRIELNAQNPKEVRQLLLKELPEIEGADELTSDLLLRFFRLQ